jgi:hypothetical protein
MKRIFFLPAILLIFACNLSKPAVVVVTATPGGTIYPTITITPSPTLTPVPSLTPLPSSTPTPDLRIINAPAQNFKLTLDDLPRGYTIVFIPICGDTYDPQCGLASDRIEGPNLNYEVLQEYGTEKGGRYINDTLRVEGWYVYYYYEYSYNAYPRVIMSNVIRFASVAGAREYMRTYANYLSPVRYTEVLGYPQTGDSSRAFIRQFYGDKYLVYEFSYKNIVQRIWFGGTEQNIAPNLIQDLSFRALLKLQAADLSAPSQYISPPTLTPAPDSPNPDTRIITAEPFDLILVEPDLPVEGGYRLFDKYSTSPRSNDEITQNYPGGKGSAYITNTARVDGWDIRYARGMNDNLLPAQIADSVSIFQSAAGARKHVTDYANYFLDDDWVEDTLRSVVVGDVSRAFIRQKGVYAEYMLVFSYRNVVHELTIHGLQAEVDPAFAEMLAFRLARSLQGEMVE